MTEILIRPAQKSDAADLAILDNLASHGISNWFWQQAVARGKTKDALDWGRSRFAGDELFAWRNAYVAVDDGMVVGGITSYLMPPAKKDELTGLKRSAPAFVPIFELSKKVENNWFVDSFAVFEAQQGKGLGEKLFKNSLLRGKHSSAKRAMLICEDTNTNALKFYEKHGFRQVDERPFIDFGLKHKVNR